MIARRVIGALCLLLGGVLTLAPESLDAGDVHDRTSVRYDLSPRGRSVVIPEQTAPGEILRVIVAGKPLPSKLELVDDDGVRVAVTERIDVRMTDAVSLAVYLFGIQSTVSPGRYHVRSSNGDETFFSAREIRVQEREFRSEEIALNRALTSLRADYDPVKIEESRVLTELIMSRDPRALFHPGPLAWPLPSDTRQTSLYGDRRTYLYSSGDRARSIHVGLDLASPVGTPIASAGDGIVRMSRDRIVTGKTVVIEHLPGIYSLYYHLDELHVDEGSMVAEGDVIGTVGATGLATGPHLHWEIRVSGVPVSPEYATSSPMLLGPFSP